MNWLIYISGWWFGGAFILRLIFGRKQPEIEHLSINILMWTMAWIWFCWRFIQ